MDTTQTLVRTEHNLSTWRSLAEVAVDGLHRIYGSAGDGLPHTMRWNGERATARGHNPRYAVIALLGLAKAKDVVGVQTALAESLWKRIAKSMDTLEASAGDLGLGLWARALHLEGGDEFTAERALDVYRGRPNVCDSVHLAWLLLGAEHAAKRGMDVARAGQLAQDAKSGLLRLYNRDTALFYRHSRRGWTSSVSRRIPCFAHQIYPVMALAVHARRTSCSESASAAQTVAENLCRLQGERGQWWWLYDAEVGGVVDGYPVFSVHQDGMAPMALWETSRTTGRDFTASVEQGLAWLSGGNELRTDMVLRDEHLILRDIHRQGVGRVRRMVHGTLWCCGWRGDAQTDGASARCERNAECRPYHLGWVLYAAALAVQAASGRTD